MTLQQQIKQEKIIRKLLWSVFYSDT